MKHPFLLIDNFAILFFVNRTDFISSDFEDRLDPFSLSRKYEVYKKAYCIYLCPIHKKIDVSINTRI
jgi:hypothetical protein